MKSDITDALMMALEGQRDFDLKIISVLISITKVLPEEAKVSIAQSILELIEEHKGGLEDMRNLHSALNMDRADGE